VDTGADLIIIGAGTAGSLLADRLSADGRRQVLVLEAGGRDDWIWFHIPVGYLFTIGNPRSDWMYETLPQPGLSDRVLAYPRGKVIGGSSAINAMIYMRGQPADYDRWRDLGLPGWGWRDVLPAFLSHEGHADLGPPLHAQSGAWRVERPRVGWPVLDAFAAGAAEAGMPACNDLTSSAVPGCGHFHVNQKRGRRWSAARGFLKPALRRPNLRVELRAHVTRVITRNGRAVAVEWSRDGRLTRTEARAGVVLAAGAIATPQILELSGIGDGDRLRALGIDTVRHLPGVGENLQDHLQLRPYFHVTGAATLNNLPWWRIALMAGDYILRRRGPLTMAPSQLGAFARSHAEAATPDIQFHVQPLSLDRFGEPLHRTPAITVSVCHLRPTSRGFVHAVSPVPGQPPAIQPNYLSTEEDRRVAVAALRLVRRVMAQPALARFQPQEAGPSAGAATEPDLLAAARQIGTSIFHPTGTARMGPDGDPGAVTDARLSVRGIAALHIADASVMPFITSGNTAAPTLMIAERAAAMIAEDLR
jgi:choline dehydrogenase-like flavoprotein